MEVLKGIKLDLFKKKLIFLSVTFFYNNIKSDIKSEKHPYTLMLTLRHEKYQKVPESYFVILLVCLRAQCCQKYKGKSKMFYIL